MGQARCKRLPLGEAGSAKPRLMRGGTQNRCGETLGEYVNALASTNLPGSSNPVSLYRPSSAACGRHLPQGEGWEKAPFQGSQSKSY
nr:MAG TPA: hypothetical protein [Caudoviricetes sp.]